MVISVSHRPDLVGTARSLSPRVWPLLAVAMGCVTAGLLAPDAQVKLAAAVAGVTFAALVIVIRGVVAVATWRERRLERRLIAEYEADMAEVLAAVTPATEAVARELAGLPLTITGFGPVKLASATRAERRRGVLLAQFRANASPAVAAR